MAGCDGWITIKIFELILSIFCIIYKRVTDDEANKLFYFLQKYSREWPLLNNITWEENGAIFTDVTYGGFIIIVIGLIIGQATGELQHHRKTENFFLVMGALMFISAGSLELAALDSVEERLVDNAAILGVISLLTGFLFLLDLLTAGKRRKKLKKPAAAPPRKTTSQKMTQTEDTKLMEVYGSDMNGNVHNGGYFPRNGAKLLLSSPAFHDGMFTAAAPPLYTASDIRTPEGRIKSTESFLRSEKGEYGRRSTTPKDQVIVPPGYVLLPVTAKRDSVTPPGYASVIGRNGKTSPGYVVVPMDEIDGRKLQSPTITTTHEAPSLGRTSQLSLSDLSDGDENGKRKYSPEYPRTDSRLSHKSLQDHRGRLNHGFDDDVDAPFRRNGSYRSTDKPKSILRFDRVRLSTKDDRYDSLDSRKIAEDLRHLREITQTAGERHDADRLEKLERKVRELEEEKKRMQENEKDRRMSEREEQYFGIVDLRQSHRESSPVARTRASEMEQRMRKASEGAKKTNADLKEKIHEQEETRKVIEDGFFFLDEEEKRKRRGRAASKAKSSPSPPTDGSDETPITDEEIRLRVETPASSYRSEAQVWIEPKESTPTSPADPGYVLHTAQNWPETPSPSPQDRFRFTAQKAQHLKMSKTPTPDVGDDEDEEDDRKSSRSAGHVGRGMTRRVDFSEVPVEELERPATVIGSTSTWRKWLQPKHKFHHTKSSP